MGSYRSISRHYNRGPQLKSFLTNKKVFVFVLIKSYGFLIPKAGKFKIKVLLTSEGLLLYHNMVDEKVRRERQEMESQRYTKS